MKKLALAISILAFSAVNASAADMAVKAPPMAPPVPAYNWSGFYIGGFVGGAWSDNNATTSDPCLVGFLAACATAGIGTYNGVPPYNYNLNSSFIGGGTIGWNWQAPSSNFVFGFENEIGYIHLNGSVVMNAPPIGNGDTSAHATIGDWYDAYTARFGVAWNQVLLYGKAGGVSAQTSTGVVDTTPPVTINSTTSKTVSGWAAGAGFEYAFASNWSFKAEYLYLGLHNITNECSQVGGFPAGTIDCNYTKISGVNTFKVGLNYRFSWAGPVVAKY
jgi:outer membrane immunogenic protein